MVRVPCQLNLRVQTINNGSGLVQEVAGPLNVGNVNGAIPLRKVRGTTKAHTVNGNVDATYAANPPGAPRYI
ncbi:MAG: hypothetical protein M3Y54_20080 [Bacteroidota bacterium]|nr:hypothetical protein [Bacteroidota bacterium]